MTINVARDYSPFVLGRFRSDSIYNGQDFMEKHLLPAIKKLLAGNEDTLLIDLNGTYSPDPSFLEEAFGGAIRQLRKENIDSSALWGRRILIEYNEAAQKKEIMSYISEALSAR